MWNVHDTKEKMSKSCNETREAIGKIRDKDAKVRMNARIKALRATGEDADREECVKEGFEWP